MMIQYLLCSGPSMDSIPSYGSDGPTLETRDVTPDEQEEKARLISQVLELQNTLDGMTETFPRKQPTHFTMCFDNFQIFPKEWTVLRKKI